MTKTMITKDLLIKHRACEEQLNLFNEIFPNGAKITKANWVKAINNGLIVDWLERVLTGEYQIEYTKVQQPAWAEYLKVQQPAWAEYQKVQQPALAEYLKVQQPAWAEYQKVQQPALAEYWKVEQPALAEYEKVRQPALAEYEKVQRLALFHALKRQYK